MAPTKASGNAGGNAGTTTGKARGRAVGKAVAAAALTWDQVVAWRARRHRLDERAEPRARAGPVAGAGGRAGLGVRPAAYMLHHADREHNACESSIIAMRHSQRTPPLR